VSKVSESVVVDASLAEVWDYYFEPRGWPAWVDGFGRIEASDRYPGAGGSLRWRSIPAGRGEVTEHVLEHEPRRFHRVAFRDPESVGELRTRFEIAGSGTTVTQEFEYRLRRRGPFAWLTDRLFIRSQVHGSVARTLARLKLEVEELAGEPRSI
jgi:Polyketide cyclase / dehydrase and lipid transport